MGLVSGFRRVAGHFPPVWEKTGPQGRRCGPISCGADSFIAGKHRATASRTGRAGPFQRLQGSPTFGNRRVLLVSLFLTLCLTGICAVGPFLRWQPYRPPHRITGCLCIHRQAKPTPRIVKPSVFTGEMLEVNTHTSMPPGSLPCRRGRLVKSRMRAEFEPLNTAGAVSSDCASVHNLAAVMQHPGDTPSPRAGLQSGMMSRLGVLETSRNTRGK